MIHSSVMAGLELGLEFYCRWKKREIIQSAKMKGSSSLEDEWHDLEELLTDK